MDVYQNLKSIGITEFNPLPSAGVYKPITQTGNLLYVSGQGSIDNGKLLVGRVGDNVTLEQAQYAAKVCAINTIAQLHHYLGDLNRIRKVVKLLGFVAGTDDFTEQAKIINNASEVFIEAFGENGKHARSAIGTNSLPLGLTVEIESIFEIE